MKLTRALVRLFAVPFAFVGLVVAAACSDQQITAPPQAARSVTIPEDTTGGMPTPQTTEPEPKDTTGRGGPVVGSGS